MCLAYQTNFTHMEQTSNTQTGSIIAIAALIATACSYFGFVISQDTIVTILLGAVAIYGVIHQIVMTKSIVTAARAAGVRTAKGVLV